MRLLHAIILTLGLANLLAPAKAATEMEDRQNIGEIGRSLFVQENFEKLETTFQTYRSQRTRTASGLWKLTILYAGVEESLSGGERTSKHGLGYVEAYDKISKWAAKYPNSPTPPILRSMVMTNQAWSTLGEDEIERQKPARLKAFYRQVEAARQTLETAKATAATDPKWYEEAIKLSRTTRLAKNDFDKLLNEALTREPLFYQTYFRALEYLLANQPNDPNVIDSFVAKAVSRTAAQEGQAMYARIYWYASQTEFGNDLFTQSPAQWEKMREGFDAVIKTYPDEWNLSNYAKFACLAGDQTRTRSILERLGSNVVVQAWYPRSMLATCASSSQPPHPKAKAIRAQSDQTFLPHIATRER